MLPKLSRSVLRAALGRRAAAELRQCRTGLGTLLRAAHQLPATEGMRFYLKQTCDVRKQEVLRCFGSSCLCRDPVRAARRGAADGSRADLRGRQEGEEVGASVSFTEKK